MEHTMTKEELRRTYELLSDRCAKRIEDARSLRTQAAQFERDAIASFDEHMQSILEPMLVRKWVRVGKDVWMRARGIKCQDRNIRFLNYDLISVNRMGGCPSVHYSSPTLDTNIWRTFSIEYILSNTACLEDDKDAMLVSVNNCLEYAHQNLHQDNEAISYQGNHYEVLYLIGRQHAIYRETYRRGMIKSQLSTDGKRHIDLTISLSGIFVEGKEGCAIVEVPYQSAVERALKFVEKKLNYLILNIEE